MSGIFVAGLDLGQSQDFTALVIAECRGTSQRLETNEPVPRGFVVETMPLAQCDVRHVERFKLKTPYQEIANQMAGRCAGMPMPRYLAVDKTGVGAGVVEMMAVLSPVAVTITSGDKVTRLNDQEYHVPKRDLVTSSQVVVQNHVLRIAKGLPHADLLTREMLNFHIKISAKGHDTYEAWREAEHDDLVLALAIAIWTAQTVISMTALEILQRYTERRWDDPISPL